MRYPRPAAAVAGATAALLLASLTPTRAPAAPGGPSTAPARTGPELRGHVDWQAHPAMHIPWGGMGFRPGLTDEAPRDLTWRHTFTQTCYTPFLKASGVRLMGCAAMAAELAESERQAGNLIQDQLEYVQDFADHHPDDFEVARSPAAARQILRSSERMVLVHQIEGGRKILLEPGDARFWRRHGVMLVTLMHLEDDELGHAAFNAGPFGALVGSFINGICGHDPNKGLTQRGRDVIVELANAGILVDLSHMTPRGLDDALAVCRAHGIPPVVTHGLYEPIQDEERGLTTEQLVEIYKLGGMYSMPVEGHALDPDHPTIPIPPGLVHGTQDMFKLTAETVHRVLREHAQEIAGKPWDQLTDAERTRFAIGWASDWNGWTDHSEPTPAHAVHGDPLEVDRVGLAHPGLLPQYFQRLREDGMDFDPFERSLERFLQIWEDVRARAGTF